MSERAEQLTGVLLGMAMGDALGLPREGLSPQRALRLYGGPPLHHQLLPGRGMVSDDTDHACLVGQALLASNGTAEDFAHQLAWGLRGWFLTLPPGLGWATLRACVRLWLFLPPEKSGVFSAGNGPAMRAPLLGACLSREEDTPRREALVRASTRLTHTDPLAEEGAQLVALAAALACRAPLEAPEVRLAALLACCTLPSWREALTTVGAHLQRGASAAELCRTLDLTRGVTGYILHTVPVALFVWLRHPTDAAAALEEVILLGGDTDTTGAIVGGLVGAGTGERGLPAAWVQGLWEWPRSVSWMRRLGAALALRQEDGPRTPAPRAPLRLCWPALPLRNLLLLALALAHGFRRLLPPW